jgi:type II secretory pathway component HofQ
MAHPLRLKILCALKGDELPVLEIGLGGRLDSVNVVDSDVAVITNIIFLRIMPDFSKPIFSRVSPK